MYTRKTRRTLKDQTIKDSFMFEAVMTDGDNCKELLEMVLGRRLTEISVSKEHSIDNNPDYKASRLDIFASDEEGTRYNIEMQVATEHTELRSRYYHSQMDMDILLAGTDYEYLPESYVIFICDYDPLGYNKYIYTMNTQVIAKLAKLVCNLELKQGRNRAEHEFRNERWINRDFRRTLISLGLLGVGNFYAMSGFKLRMYSW